MDYPGNRRRRRQPQPQQQPRRARQPNQAQNLHHQCNAEEFKSQAEALIPAEVVMISGCHSLETSADVSNAQSTLGRLPSAAGTAGGACTSVLLSILYDEHRRENGCGGGVRKGYGGGGGKLTFQKLLLEMRERLSRSGMTQIPQLTSSRRLDLREMPFSLVNPNEGHKGTRRALLVGINYYGQDGQLSGCINDVVNVKKYLLECYGYSERNVTLLIDEAGHSYPTRDNMIQNLRRLVKESSSGDTVYFHYSGHGGLLSPNPLRSALEKKKIAKQYDETLYPVDHQISGQIRDFNLFNHFVKPMAGGVFVTCVMDCCHSGSVLDLPYSYMPTGTGNIIMRQSIDTLSNLALLYVMAGGNLPYHVFGSLLGHIEDAVGLSVDSLQGMGLEELTSEIGDGMEFGTNGFCEEGFCSEDQFCDNIGKSDARDAGNNLAAEGRFDEAEAEDNCRGVSQGGCGEDDECGGCDFGEIISTMLEDDE